MDKQEKIVALPPEIIIIILEILLKNNPHIAIICNLVCRDWHVMASSIIKGGEYKFSLVNLLMFLCLHGYLNALRWFDETYPERNYGYYQHAYLFAVRSGKIEILYWLRYEHEKATAKSQLHPRISRIAIKKGRLDMLQWLYREGCSITKSATVSAAVKGNLEILKWLRAQNVPWDKYTFEGAARSKNLEMLKWMHQKGCPWDKGTFHNAALIGDWNILKWLFEKKCPWGSDAYWGAAEVGHLDVIQWLWNNGVPWNENTSTYAAMGGHRKILKWIHISPNNYPWRPNTTRYLARFGHLKVLKWVIKKGCEINFNAYIDAKQEMHIEIMEWLATCELTRDKVFIPKSDK